jgi:pimeloyl-ACP methyl ester carboxylesterase
MGPRASRLDLCFGEQLAAERGIRLVSFDRPGYGGSTAAPFGLASIAADAHAIADELAVDRFATLGWSGGGHPCPRDVPELPSITSDCTSSNLRT